MVCALIGNKGIRAYQPDENTNRIRVRVVSMAKKIICIVCCIATVFAVRIVLDIAGVNYYVSFIGGVIGGFFVYNILDSHFENSRKTNIDQQKQIDDLKRELEEMKRKE